MGPGSDGYCESSTPPPGKESVANVAPIDVLVDIALPLMGDVVAAAEERPSDDNFQAHDSVAENTRYLANGEDDSALDNKFVDVPSVESVPHGELTHMLIETCDR